MIIKCILLICIINNIYSIKFFFNEPAKSMKCLGEYISESTLGIFIKF